jgi:hypothetical protein
MKSHPNFKIEPSLRAKIEPAPDSFLSGVSRLSILKPAFKLPLRPCLFAPLR